MSQSSRSPNRSLASLAIATLVLIVTFALIGFVTLSVVIDNDSRIGNSTILELPTPGPGLSITTKQSLVGTPDPSAMLTFRSAALGFALEYPRTWRKKEGVLEVIFSPSAAGLDSADDLDDAAIWIGIPVDNTADPGDLLTHILTSLSPNSQPLSQEIMIGGRSWHSAEINFEDESLGGPAIATVATTSKDEVGYFIVAVAPTEQRPLFRPIFQRMINSFRFTSEAVLRPTHATRPPTPTPTPTPLIYVVQSGDTLIEIALEYGVDVEALTTKNGIDDPRSLRVGTKLIIPIKRRR